MNRLEIRMLGPLQVLADGREVTDFETESTRALLAYLAGEAGRAKSRRLVAEMLWPDRPEGAALSNLRHALSVLRRAIGDRDSAHPVLLADRSTVTIDPAGPVSIDLIEFERLASTPGSSLDAVERWTQAAELHRGDLLEGLDIRAGAEWDEWLVTASERVRRRLAGVLRQLADHHERSAATETAIPIARRLASVDPWDDRNHLRFMRLLVRVGDEAGALAHFDEYRARLADEFGLEPDQETITLAAQIRSGDVSSVTGGSACRPRFLETAAPARSVLFVERTEPISSLRGHLVAALSGVGRVVFVRGEAGSGKTMLADEFVNRAMDLPELLAARGRCSAFGELGDPYLPFRELLGLLTGDVESGYSVGALDRRHALRLWEAVPHSAQLISEIGPDLLGSMIDGPRLVDRVEQAAPDSELSCGLRRVMKERGTNGPSEREQAAVFEQLTEVLTRLSVSRPLLLVIDDLQWADRGSLALLWHLLQHIESLRGLIVGLYRPGEIEDRPESQLSLADIVRQAQVKADDAVIDVVGDRAFLDEFIDTEPNALDTDFRDVLFSYTGGHPLFTVEMVRGMQERGEIRRDRSGAWVVSQDVDFDRLPSRVEAVIAQNLARLPAPFREDLTVASIQGEEFIDEVVAALREDDHTARRLALECSAPSRLIEASGCERVDGSLVSRYRFRHALFQHYLYGNIDEARRVQLHEATGRMIERLYMGQRDVPVHTLAMHFDRAGLAGPAIEYLQQAGVRALRMSAPEEAITLFRRALELLDGQPESNERNELELGLLVSLTAPVMAVRGYAAPEMGQIGGRVRELCDLVEPSVTEGLALLGLGSFHAVRGEYELAESASRKALRLAETLDDDALRLVGHQQLGLFLTFTGDLEGGHDSLRRAAQLYDAERHAWLAVEFGSAIGPEATAWGAANSIQRGDFDEAHRLGERAIRLARETGHALTICHATAIGGAVVRLMSGELEASSPYIEEVAAIAREARIPFYSAAASMYRGVTIGFLDEPDEGIAAIEAGLEAWRRAGVAAYLGWFLSFIADLHLCAARPDRALSVIEDGITETQASGEILSMLPLRLGRGRALTALDRLPDADREFDLVLNEARAIGARLLELRAATEIAIHARRAGDDARAHEVLEPVSDLIDLDVESMYLASARAQRQR